VQESIGNSDLDFRIFPISGRPGGSIVLISDKEVGNCSSRRETSMNTATSTDSVTTTLADEVLDSRNVSCPLPIIQTAQAIAGLSSGQTLLVMASDPGFEPDIKAWSSRTGNPLLSSDRRGNELHVLLRKA
jgi:tRNA 2-thiouridine synthesizing protein A